MKILTFLVILVWTSLSYAQYFSNQDKLNQIGDLSRIAIGSCNNQLKRQTVWPGLLADAPDLFIWGGDNVYADSDVAENIRKAYQIQNSVEPYLLFKSQTPIIGTWDDHDYGANNSGYEYALKKQSQQMALDFLEEPATSPRRFQEGIYTSYDFESEGNKVKIIMLDNRYFKDQDMASPMLGPAQWSWLEKELKHSKADLILIVSGLSILSPTAPASEEWADYPAEQERLKQLLKAHGKPYLYVTGDKHFSSIFRQQEELEFLVSGMTHNTRIAWRPYIRLKYPNHVFVHNYGLIDFSWDQNTPILTLTVRSSYGQDLLVKRITWPRNQWVEIK